MDLVVGATGFAGKRIAKRLKEKRRRVRALVCGGATRAEAKELNGAAERYGIQLRSVAEYAATFC